MKTIRQQLRQPMKTLLGVILMTLAVSVLCVCVGQSLATQTTKEALDQRFSTVAIPSLQEDLFGADRILVDAQMIERLQEIMLQHPDIVKDVAYNGFLSAYIPQMSPYNTQSYENVSKNKLDPMFYTFEDQSICADTYYDSAMLVITLDSVSEILSPMENFEEPLLGRESFTSASRYNAYLRRYERRAAIVNALRRTDASGYKVMLTGTITQVLSLPDGLRDPLGMNARLTLTLPSLQDIENLQLTCGEQYIVYGLDYFDDYQFLVEYMKTTGFKHVSFAPFNPALLKAPTEHEIESFRNNKSIDVVMLYNYAPLEQWQYDMFNTVSMSLCLPSNILPYDQIVDEYGQVIMREPAKEVTYTDPSGQSYTMSMDDFVNRYGVPTIARVDGSVQDFLASSQGERWQEALHQSKVNNHAFSVVGVKDIHHLGAFALEMAKIGEGREFTAEEVANGAKVCIIHEWVAQNSGLQIGDTVTLSFYQTDYAIPYQTTIVQDKGWLRPAASYYHSTTPFTETAEYTIIGYWQGDVWPDEDSNYYSFSANTVFVPETSVQTTMEHRNSIPFVSIVMENGTIRQFHDLAKRSGYAGLFKYIDQGYSDIATNFHNYAALGQQIMGIGVALYAILLLMFLLLYPTTQRRAVRTMEGLGCSYIRRFAHVLLTAMTIIVSATILGCVTGYLTWDRVVAALQATTESSVALQLEPNVLTMVALAQLLLSLALSILVALIVALPRGLSARR